MLAGYTSSNSSAGHWGIVSQTPKEAILEQITELEKSEFGYFSVYCLGVNLHLITETCEAASL
ncbi:hypothetical protein L2D08_12795 [Domibacillus sp. PGB-M46]|uniref:hypothetical protein n=1 Tax=Domibacillus sp. PGB-M46 TaxID=2910255 RepID=UPI001F5788CC|nr:hypothetical protein [Domibacillus sp. PGB-M46]MCI2255245.1 hypothetical protein [Domibacillus sp. PGB-M46]